jgi:nitronate monooxygenase
VPDYPIAHDAAKALATAAKAQGNGSFGAQWAGQGAPRARDARRRLVTTLAEELRAARHQ